MSTVLLILRLCFWRTAAQRLGTLVGSVLVLVEPAVWPRWSIDLMTLGILIACLPLLALGGSMWRAASAQRAVMLAPRGRLRLLAAAATVAAVVALSVTALHHLSMALWVISGLLPYTTSFGHMGLGFLDASWYWRSWWLSFAFGFGFATWWGIGTFIVSRSPLAALIVIIVLVGASLGVPVVASYLVDTPWCRDSTETFCSLVASSLRRGSLPTYLTVTFAWSLFGLWYLNVRRIAPPGWLMPGGQSVLATAAVENASGRPPTRAAALERMLLGGSSIVRILGQWLLAGLLLLAMLLVVARRTEPDYVAWALRAMLVAASGIMLALSLAALRRARALWLPAGLDRAGLHQLTRNGLLKLALGFTLVLALFLVAHRYALPWPARMSLPLAGTALLAANLLWVGHALHQGEGWLRIAQLGAVLWLWCVGFAAPLLRGEPHWGWLAAMLVAAAALLLLARRRWLNGDLPGPVTA